MKYFQLSFACLLAITLLTGCGTGRATLFVDNDSKSGIRVEIEGEKGLYVGPGKHGKRHVKFGDKKIVVRKGDKIIFEETKTFEPYEKGPGWRHYLLDPQGDTRYSLYDVYYYEDTKKSKSKPDSKRVKRLAKKKWVEIPRGAAALEAMPIVITTDDGDRATRQCVFREK